MSAEGKPDHYEPVDAAGLKITIVAGLWHEVIAEALLAGARRILGPSGAEVTEIRVAGSFELPVVARVALDEGADAVVALGVIIRGGTPHFEYVSDAATSGLTQVSILTGKPVGFGVLTLDNEEQGIERAGLPGSKEDKGAEVAEAVLRTAVTIKALRSHK